MLKMLGPPFCYNYQNCFICFGALFTAHPVYFKNFIILQYYFRYIIQQLMKMNIFLCKRSLFRETAEKAIILNYNVIKDVMMMQCIYQYIRYFIPAKD